jgi:uncharacterized protein (TIGR00730 family)
MKIFIGCSSSDEIDRNYLIESEKYLEKIFAEDNDLVFGACNKGIMGSAYKAAIKNKRQVISLCTKAYQDDLNMLNSNESLITNSIMERTEKLLNICDAIVFLPGGVGTMCELFSAIDSKRTKEFDKPIIIYNINNYFDDAINMLNKIYKEKFSDESIRDCYHISTSYEDTIDYLNNYEKQHI